VILRIIITQMAARFNVLLEERFLRCEVVLSVKEMPTATTGLSLTCRTLGASALGREASLRPKAVLTDDTFHALEPPRIRGVIIWKVKGLLLAHQGVDAITHAWPLRVVRPETLGIYRSSIR
jgi:hypothetical protein